MSLLSRASALRKIKSFNKTFSTCLARPASYNLDDFKPGPYPKTKEERDAAAKKYGLLPAEYEPLPESDGLGYGDYPKLPDISGDDKDPFYPWTNPEHKRNFGEPLHHLANLIGEDRYNISMKPRFTRTQMWASFLGILGFIFGTYYLVEPYPHFKPLLEKQMPAPGVVHYTFEKSDSRPEPEVLESAVPESINTEPQEEAQQTD